MTVQTRVYNGLTRVATLSTDTVHISFDSSASPPCFRYSTHVITRIESDTSTSDKLLIEIDDGVDWKAKDARILTTSGGESGINWTHVQSTLELRVWYPSVTNAPATWEISDQDAPPIVLKVVVKRIP